MDVHHVPRCLNIVADGLSWACEGTAHKEGNGSKWTVSEDWEAMTGLTHDIFFTTNVLTHELAGLQEQFKNKPIFMEVINTILEMDHGTSLRL